ncbi:MAG: hypothetical protein A3G34_16170 [Candidatus Lindowbacteria bacterium RIFCSPLOWO2_12_FULL_62_27]|nr:MAG: hypothetical protein A3I06_12285 [Candidatus Lindowbacteria bacterium RIFCSPLOWO2_02_FULL_62_12]OGH61159.1 MAG: hypothetical protein A3G34_16170 [Candidatus Lindowbacteria bacterium RIFCSPLOWO2_12_FULL_62_27]
MNGRRKIFGLLTSLALSLLCPIAVSAKSQSGGVVDPSTILGFGARPSGMGNAFVAAGSDATAVFWNPSALDRDRRKEMFGQYSQPFFDNTFYNMLAYKHPVGRFGTIGGGLILEGADDLVRRDEFGTNLGTFDVGKMNLMFGYGKQMTQGLYLGSSLHLVRHQGGGFSGTGVGLDAGVLYRFTHAHLEYSRAYLRLAQEELRLDADRYFERGARAFETGKFTEAFENFQKTLETDPRHARARVMLARTADRDRSLDARLKSWSPANGQTAVAEFMKRKTGASTLDDWFREGVRLYDAGKLKDAIPFFETVIRRARQSNVLNDRLSLGLNAQNLLQPSIKLDRASDRIPSNFKFGAAFQPVEWLLLALDADVPSKGPQRMHFGVEWRPLTWLAVRAGLDGDEPTIGFGFRFQDMKFDYAFEPSDDLDNNFQRIGLSYEFGRSHGDIVSAKIQRGLLMKSEKEHRQAVGEWESAMKLQPQNPVARSYIESSNEEYRRRVTDPWDSVGRQMEAGRWMEAHQALASILEYDPQFAPARDAKTRLDAGVPQYVESTFARGRLKFLQADYQAAEEAMTAVVYFRPDIEPARQYLESSKRRNETVSRDRRVREWHLQGLSRYRAGDWAAALDHFQKVLSHVPAHPAAGEVVEQILAFQKARFDADERRVEAERYFRTAAADFLNERWGRAERMVSHSLALLPAHAEAHDLLNHILAQQNQSLRALLSEGDEEMTQGRVDAAVERWHKAIDLDPENTEARTRIEKHWDKIVDFIESQTRLAAKLAEQGAYKESILSYNRILTVDPFNPVAAQGQSDARARLSSLLRESLARAEYFYQAGAYDKSAEALSELLALDPASQPALELKSKADEKAQAQAKLGRAAGLGRQGQEFFDTRRFNDAVAAWQSLVTEFGSDPSPELQRFVEKAREQIDIAVREAEWAESAELLAEYLRAGDGHYQAGRLVDALENYARAESLAPDHPEVQGRIRLVKESLNSQIPLWIAEGQSHAEAQRWDDAQAAFRSVLLVDPQNPDAAAGMDRVVEERRNAADRLEDVARAEELTGMAIESYRAGAHREALEHLEAARELQPDQPEIQRLIRELSRYVQVDEVYREALQAFQSADYKTAMAKFQSVAVLRPDDASVRDFIEKCRQALRGRDRESVERLVASATQHAQSADQAALQSRYDLALGRIQKAMDLYQKARKQDPENTGIRQSLREAESKAGAWRKIWNESKSADYKKYLYSGMSHYTSGRYREAIADWNRVLAADPEHILAKEYIRRAEKKLSKLEQ